MRTGSIGALLDKGKLADGVGTVGSSAGSGGHGKGAEDVDGALKSGSIAQDWQDGSVGKGSCTVRTR